MDEAGQNREGGLRARSRADLRGGTCIVKIGRYNAFQNNQKMVSIIDP